MIVSEQSSFAGDESGSGPQRACVVVNMSVHPATTFRYSALECQYRKQLAACISVLSGVSLLRSERSSRPSIAVSVKLLSGCRPFICLAPIEPRHPSVTAVDTGAVSTTARGVKGAAGS